MLFIILLILRFLIILLTSIILVIIIIILAAIIILLLIVVILIVVSSSLLWRISSGFVLVFEELVDLFNKPVMLDGIALIKINHLAPVQTLFQLIMLRINFLNRHFLLSTGFVYAFEFALLQISLLLNTQIRFLIVLLSSNKVFLRVEWLRIEVQTLLLCFGVIVGVIVGVLILHTITFATERILL